MNKELTEFLRRNRACGGGIMRLEASGAETLENAWARADERDLVWAVTRPGVMSADQRRRFLAEAVLAPIEHLLTDERSKNILQKLRTNEHITQEDKDAAQAAARAASEDASDAAWAAAWAASEDASDAEWSAADAVWAAAARKAAREQQARWIRTNFRLADLRTK